MAKTMTANEVAKELDTTPKTLRKFLRSEDSGVESVGQGKRYAIPAGQVGKLKKAFVAWTEAHKREAEEDAVSDASTE